MKKVSIITLFCFIALQSLDAQKIQYGGIQQFGLSFRESGSNTSFNIVNGIRFNRFFMGIGVDAQFNQRNNGDYYYYSYSYRSIPNNTSALYLDARYYINKKKNFYTVANAGANYINQKMFSNDREKFQKRVGYYGAVGLGFKAKLGGEVFYSFDVCYGMRQTRYDYSYKNFINEWQTEKNDLRQGYLIVRMGFEIF